MTAQDVTCPACDGTGVIIRTHNDVYQGPVKYEYGCTVCWGHGTVHPSLIPYRYKKKATK